MRIEEQSRVSGENQSGHARLSGTNKSLSIILPCYNEEKAVIPVLDRLHSLWSAWKERSISLREVLIVDDGSTDGTRRAVEGWRESHDSPAFQLVVIPHERRRGYGAALKNGISHAQSDYLAFYDVDGTYDPGTIPKMIELLDSTNSEMICGDRLSTVEHMPYTREIGNRLFVGTINVLYRTRVFDSCTGMRVFRKNMSPFFASHALPDGLDYSLAMTLAFLRTGHRLIEMPIPYAKRIGRSKLSVLADGPRFFLRILGSWIHTSAHLREVADARKRAEQQALQSAVVSKKE